jgi:hypothetical protein
MMTNKSIRKLALFGLFSICLSTSQVVAQSLPTTSKTSPNIYEDERIRIVVQDCNRKLPDLICQAVLTSKSSDRSIELNGNAIKLVDLEGNEYYPTSLRLANRNGENNTIKAELVENIPFKATFTFSKIPTNLTKFALLQIPVGGSLSAMGKFRDLTVVDSRSESPRQRTTTTPSNDRNSIAIKPAKSSIVPAKSTSSSADISSENNLICPDNTKILYRATSKSYLLYICGAKNPTHYVGIAKDGTQGIVLRLRYFDRSQFSADNGDTNYTIAANRLVIRKDDKLIYQEKIQVLQALSLGAVPEEVAPKSKPKKNSSAVSTNSKKSSSSSQPVPRSKRQPIGDE